MIYRISCSLLVIYFSQKMFSFSFVDDGALRIIKSIDEYLCQNYLLTCFFRQRFYSQSNKKNDSCQSFFILCSCLNDDVNSIRICHPLTLKQVRNNFVDQIPTSCQSKINSISSIASSLTTTKYQQIFYMSSLMNFTFVIHLLFIDYFRKT